MFKFTSTSTREVRILLIFTELKKAREIMLAKKKARKKGEKKVLYENWLVSLNLVPCFDPVKEDFLFTVLDRTSNLSAVQSDSNL